MREAAMFLGVALVALVVSRTVASGNDVAEFSCHVCTCANEQVVCVEEQVEEQMALEELGESVGVCGQACSSIGSSHGSRQTVQTPCSEVLACTAAQRTAPAAGPVWLSAAALGMAVLGGAVLRRSRRR